MTDQLSLFGSGDTPSNQKHTSPATSAGEPLAARMRPRTLDEIVGQEHLLGSDRILRRSIESDHISSMIFWGPPGSGKTTLAEVIAHQTHARYVRLSAVSAGVADLRKVVEEARRSRQRTILFIDEIHRFNKSQQDALLPAVEDGTVTLIGATTENPSFEVNSALLSRSRVLVLNALPESEIEKLIRRAMTDIERGLGDQNPEMPEDLVSKLAKSSGGDARVALSALEAAVNATMPGEDGIRRIDEATVIEALGRAQYAYDKGGEDHYNLASALIKSLRNSDVNASLYWLARLIAGGADPIFIARRLCILASEDIGLADPQAMVQAAAAAEITRLIGLPEGLFPLSQATIYLAKAPKSNAIKRAYQAAAADAAETARAPVPLHLRNAVTPLMKQIGYGSGYRYVHDDPDAKGEMQCLPKELANRIYYSEDGDEERENGNREGE